MAWFSFRMLIALKCLVCGLQQGLIDCKNGEEEETNFKVKLTKICHSKIVRQIFIFFLYRTQGDVSNAPMFGAKDQ